MLRAPVVVGGCCVGSTNSEASDKVALSKRADFFASAYLPAFFLSVVHLGWFWSGYIAHTHYSVPAELRFKIRCAVLLHIKSG